MLGARRGGWPADWPRWRKAILIAFALIMAYLHSFYILGFYVSGMEYWGTVWIGVTTEQRLLSFGHAVLANLGPVAMLFLRKLGRLLRFLLAISLSCGALISVGWLTSDLWRVKFSPLWPFWSLGFQELGVIRLSIHFIVHLVIRAIYAASIVINLYFMMIIIRGVNLYLDMK